LLGVISDDSRERTGKQNRLTLDLTGVRLSGQKAATPNHTHPKS